MSSHIVEVVPFSLKPIENSDFLSLAQIKGWQCVVRTEDFKRVEKAIYIPIDSIVPDTEEFAFLDRPAKGVSDEDHMAKLVAEGAKYARKKYRRVKTLKLRGVISQGILLPVCNGEYQLGENVAEKLGITKYEPPLENTKVFGGAQSPFLRDNPPFFHKYTDIENIKHFPDVIKTGTKVVWTEKIHGTNTRIGLIWNQERIGWDMFVGSHNKMHLEKYTRIVEHEPSNWFLRLISKVYPLVEEEEIVTDNPFVFWKMANRLDLYNRLVSMAEALNVKSVILFGEVFGQGIQDLKYGLDDIAFRLFDISANGDYLNWEDLKNWAGVLGLVTVPVLSVSKFSKASLEKHTGGMSTIAPDQIREGCVVRPLEESWHPNVGRVILKSISSDYLLRKGGSEDH